MSDPKPKLCRSCSDSRDEDCKLVGKFRNSPGRRTARNCDDCDTRLGEVYRPVEVA